MTSIFPTIPDEQRVRRLQPPDGPISMVLDTDAYNEIDDQFAIVYAMLSKEKINLKAIYAAPFHNENSDGPGDGMEKSYEEIIRIATKMDVSPQNFVYRGSGGYLPGASRPVESEAARDLIAKALAAPDDEPLYVAAIGAITNVASAILLEPRIIDKIVVVWLGGHALNWQDTKEFNLVQDIPAARVLFDCGVPLVLLPVMGVSSHLTTTLSEVNDYVRGRGAIGDFLAERYESCRDDHFGYSRVIWDISVIAYLLKPDAVQTELIPSPVLTDGATWSRDSRRHLIRYANYIHRDAVFQDLFRKLESAASAIPGRSK